MSATEFEDRISSGLGEKAAAYLRRKGAKLIMHDFVTPLPGGGQRKLMESMAKKTGGELFLKELN